MTQILRGAIWRKYLISRAWVRERHFLRDARGVGL
jgi:hypothetical protein